MKFVKKKQFLRSLPKIERQTVNAALKGQMSSEFLESRFFLDNILTRLQQKFAAHFTKCKPQLLAQLRREQQNTHAKVQSIPDFRNQTPEDVVRYFQMAPQTFIEKVFSILNGRTVVPSAAGTISSARAGPQEAFNALAGNFFDDYAKAAVVAEQYPIIWSEERLREVHQADLEQFPRSILAQLSDPSTGKASFNRAKQILDYMLLQLPMEQFNNAMIDNWARNSDRQGHYDILGAVRQMVSEQVARAGQAIKWWTTIVRSRVQEYAAAVVSDMVASHVANANGEIRAFYEKVASTFCAWVEKDILVPMEERWDESVNLFSNYFPVDISVRTLLFVAVSPVEDLIYRVDCTRYPSQPVPRNGQPAKEAQAEREDIRPAILKAVQDAIIILRDSMDTEGDTEDEAFEKCLPPLKPFLPNDERHLLKVRDLIVNNQVNDLTTYFLKSMPRPESKAELVAPEAPDLTAGRAMIHRIEKIREVIRESGKEVRFQDAVQGGYQTVHEQPDTMVVHDYLRSAAYEYYVMIIDRFLFDFDASYSNFCFNKLEMSRMNAPIAFMNNMLAQEPVRDGLVAARQAEINSLKEEYEHLQEQKEEIDRVCTSLLSD